MRLAAVGLALAALAAFGLAGCGDAPQELAQKERRYQGKPDANPWDSAEFGGDKAKWETALKTRQLNQNEYTRAE
jgi:hypothetical protein